MASSTDLTQASSDRHPVRRISQLLESADRPGWRVYEQQRWDVPVRPDGPRRTYQADFVLVAPGNGVLVGDIKSGRIRHDNAGWWMAAQVDRERARSPIVPVRTAAKSLDALVQSVLGEDRVPVGYALVLPDMDEPDDIPGADQKVWSHLILARDLASPASFANAVERLLGLGAPASAPAAMSGVWQAVDALLYSAPPRSVAPPRLELVSASVSNFKGFSRPAELPLRPITLIYGENSAGKTSLIQSLLLLKQSMAEDGGTAPTLTSKGSLVNLGSYRELIHRHETSRSLSFEFGLRLAGSGSGGVLRTATFPARLRLDFELDRKSALPMLQRLALSTADAKEPAITFRLDEGESRRVMSAYARPGSRTLRVEEVDFSHPIWRAIEADTRKSAPAEFERRHAQLRALRNRLAHQPTTSAELSPLVAADLARLNLEIESLEKSLPEALAGMGVGDSRAMLRADLETQALVLRGFLPVAVGRVSGRETYYSGASSGASLALRLVQSLAGQVERFLAGFSYLGPLRQIPDRLYVHAGGASADVGKAGENMPDLLFRSPELVERANDALERFDLGYRIEVSRGKGPSADLQDVFAVRLKDKKSRVDIGLSDVGFGVGQVLPLIVQSLLAQRRTIAVEQPEIHLHPRLQAELGSLFVTASRPPFGNRFLIETHSEHILLRLQRLIRGGDLPVSDVAVMYVRRGRWASQTSEIRLNERGDFLDPWPGGFFEEGLREVFDLDAR